MSMLILSVTCFVRNIECFTCTNLWVCYCILWKGGQEGCRQYLFLSFAVGIGLIFNIFSCTLAGVMASALRAFPEEALL